MSHPQNAAELKAVIEDIGLLPFSHSSIAGFSADDMCPGAPWYTGEEADPWHMRTILAGDADIVYGKLFDGKTGFVCASLYARFANVRRNGYDFDTLVDMGLIGARERAVMAAALRFNGPMYAFELRRMAGFGADGYKGFDSTVAGLQQRCYLLSSGFARKKDRFGCEYGWEVNLYDTPERRFGAAFPDEAYREEPEESLAFLVDRVRSRYPVGEAALRSLITGNMLPS